MWDSLQAIDPRPAISSVRPTLVILAEPAASQQAQAGRAGVRDSVVRERPFATATDEATVGQSAEVLGGVLVALGRGLCVTTGAGPASGTSHSMPVSLPEDSSVFASSRIRQPPCL